MPWLGALGQRTSRALMGTSVLTPTLRYHPSVVAQSFATLACMAPGRVFLGVGTGEAMNETPPTGAAWPGAKERRLRLREAIELMRRLWTEERVTFEGDYYRTQRATVYDRPDEPVPVFVAASGPLAAKLAGRVGDGFICTSGKQPELYRELLDAVEEGAEAAGRDPAAIVRMIEIKVSYDHDADYARDACRWWAALSLTPEEKTGVEDPVEMERLADAAADRAHSRFIVSADPDAGRRPDRAVHRPRLHAPRVPRARRGPAALPRPVLRGRRAAAALTQGKGRLVGEPREHLQLKLAERLARRGAGNEEAHTALVERERRDRDITAAAELLGARDLLVLLGTQHEGLRSLRERLSDHGREACCEHAGAMVLVRVPGRNGEHVRTGLCLEPQRHIARIEHLPRQTHDALLDVVALGARKRSRVVEQGVRHMKALLAVPRETAPFGAPSPSGTTAPRAAAAARP